MRKFVSVTGTCLLITAFALTESTTLATTLLPGSTLSLSSEAEPVGASILTFVSSPFAGVDVLGNTNFTGTLTSTVWTGDTSNPYFGGLTFTYLLSNNASSADPLVRMTLSRFDGFQTDVSYFGLGSVPTSVERSLSNSGRQVAFNFETPFRLQPGNSSALLIIQTDAFAWQYGNASVIDDATANALTLVPANVIPEPSSLALLVIGGMMLSARCRRKS